MKRTHSWLVLAAMVVASLAGVTAAHARGGALGVDVWTDRGDDAVYRPGEAMQVKVRATDDAYLLVYEIDAEGRISVLYPWRRTGAVVEGHRTYRLPPADSKFELVVDQTVGQGFLVAIASREPFRDLPWYLRPFDPQGEVMGYENQHIEEEGFDEDGAVVGDPMVAMERIRRRVLQHAGDTDLFATSYATYYVGQEVRYPRYLCSDCHRRGQWAWWDGFDPYYSRCSVFDFRVNWGWAWGPQCWSGHVPYYYYVVRSDCPPSWQHWYDDHSRWSSWDDHRERESVWGGPPRRYKSDHDRVNGGPAMKPWGGGTPPGYLPPGSIKPPGEHRPLPVGRMDRPGDGSGVVDRGRKSDAPNGGVSREPRKPTQPGDWTPRDNGRGSDRGSDRGRPQAEPTPPRQERRADPAPAEKPRREERAPDPPRNDPPKQERRADPPPSTPAPPPPPAKPAHERGDRKGDK